MPAAIEKRLRSMWADYRDAVLDKRAYVPDDITAPVSNPVATWGQFCTEALLKHDGVLAEPMPQKDVFL